MLTAVLDTNVFVSGLLTPEGTPARALDAWRQGRYILATSPALVTELVAVLSHPRIRARFSITAHDLERLLSLLRHDALLVPGRNRLAAGTVPADPADEAVLACALDARADLVVSGDRHLLDLGAFRGIPVVTPRGFLDRLEAG